MMACLSPPARAPGRSGHRGTTPVRTRSGTAAQSAGADPDPRQLQFPPHSKAHRHPSFTSRTSADRAFELKTKTAQFWYISNVWKPQHCVSPKAVCALEAVRAARDGGRDTRTRSQGTERRLLASTDKLQQTLNVAWLI